MRGNRPPEETRKECFMTPSPRGQESSGTAAVFHREVQRMTSRPLYLLFTLVVPVVTFLLLWAIFSRGVVQELPVIVCDRDESALSRHLARMIDATPSMKISRRVGDMAAGRELLMRREGYALILFPHDLERDVFRGRSPQAVCYYNNQFLVAGSIINRDFHQVVETLSTEYAGHSRLIFGEKISGIHAHGEPIDIDSHILFNPQLSYLYFLGSTLMPSMLQIFVLMMTVFCIGIELKEGSAGQWLQTAGHNAGKAMAGKLLPYTLLYLIVGLFMQALLFWYLDVPLKGSALMIILSTSLLVLACQAVGALIVALMGNLRMSLSSSAFYSLPAFAFSGVSFPFPGMSFLGKAWSLLLPLTYYLELFVDQSLRGTPEVSSLRPLLLLGLFCVLIVPATLRLKQLMKDERHWGLL